MAHLSRREFLKTGLAAGALAAFGNLSLKALQPDPPPTGSRWANPASRSPASRSAPAASAEQVQRSLGQEDFNKLVRYAYDNGIRFFETAESYGDMHRMLGIALKGIPRDSYRLMSKVTTHDDVDPQARFDELRKLAQTDYFDIMLLHWQHTATWPADTARWQDGILEAQTEKGRHRAAAPRFTACPLCARFPATSGSKSP